MEGAYIDIIVDVDRNQFVARIENTAKEVSSEHGGLGMKNLKRRLELLYPENHRLVIDHRDGIHMVELSISNL